mgnify:CR=1 FL=1
MDETYREMYERKNRRIMELADYCEKNNIFDAQTIAELAMRFYSVSPSVARDYAEIVQARLLYRRLKPPVTI